MKKQNKKIKNKNINNEATSKLNESITDNNMEIDNEEEFEITKEAMQKISMIPLLEWMRGKRLRYWGWGILHAILLSILATQIKLIQLNSESIPYKYCVQLNNIDPEKGELCVFDYRKYKFVKYLVGIEGDRIKRIGSKVFVNDKFICDVKSDNDLTPIDDTIIPKGSVFVMGTHADSLDSRYKEFGLVKVGSLKGKAIGCFER